MDEYLDRYMDEQDAAARVYESDAAFRHRLRRYAELWLAGVELPPALDELARRGIESEVR